MCGVYAISTRWLGPGRCSVEVEAELGVCVENQRVLRRRWVRVRAKGLWRDGGCVGVRMGTMRVSLVLGCVCDFDVCLSEAAAGRYMTGELLCRCTVHPFLFLVFEKKK